MQPAQCIDQLPHVPLQRGGRCAAHLPPQSGGVWLARLAADAALFEAAQQRQERPLVEGVPLVRRVLWQLGQDFGELVRAVRLDRLEARTLLRRPRGYARDGHLARAEEEGERAPVVRPKAARARALTSRLSAMSTSCCLRLERCVWKQVPGQAGAAA